jgi:class I fructose-bisphosphate aldolase
MITKDGKYLFLAFDHCIEHGAQKYEVDLNPKRIAKIAERGKVDALIIPLGSYNFAKPKVNVLIKVTGKTELVEEENQIQAKIAFLEELKGKNIVGIAATVYVGSKYEYLMLENFARLRMEARKRKKLITGFFYPRTKKYDRYSYEAVAYSARLGCEMDADIIKTYYTGSKESFKKVVEKCFKPIVIAGGPKIDEKDFIKNVKDAIEAGASGIAVGRNVWEREDSEAIELLKELREIVHG